MSAEAKSLAAMRLRFLGKTYRVPTNRLFIVNHILPRPEYSSTVESLADMLTAKVNDNEINKFVTNWFNNINTWGFKEKHERQRYYQRRSDVKRFLLSVARARQLGFVVASSNLEGFGLFLLDTYASQYKTVASLVKALSGFAEFYTPQSAEEQQFMLDNKFVSVIGMRDEVLFLNGVLSFMNHDMYSRLVFSNSHVNLVKPLDRGRCKILFLFESCIVI